MAGRGSERTAGRRLRWSVSEAGEKKKGGWRLGKVGSWDGERWRVGGKGMAGELKGKGWKG